MKIAIFTDMYLEVAGGIPSSVQAQKLSLEKAGHEVTVFCPGWEGSLNKIPTELRRGVVVVPTCRYVKPGGAPLARNPDVVQKWVLERYPMFSQFDVVHVHYETGCSIAGVRLARMFKVPLVQTMHGREDAAVAVNIPFPFKTLVGVLLNWFHSWFLPHSTKVRRDNKCARTVARASMWTMMVNHASYANLVLTPSTHFGRKLRHYGVKRPVQTLSNGIADELAEGEYGVRSLAVGEPLKMIWNSRVSHEKRIMPFLAALRQMDAPFRLEVYGGGNDLGRARRYVQRHGMSDSVIFHGVVQRDEILRAMREAHLGIMASYDFDTQGMTLLEAEAVGLPVFFCDPDMKEVVPDGSYVCSRGPSAEEMAEALMDLAKHPERVAEMSKVMMQHRAEVLQSARTKELVAIYKKVKV